MPDTRAQGQQQLHYTTGMYMLQNAKTNQFISLQKTYAKKNGTQLHTQPQNEAYYQIFRFYAFTPGFYNIRFANANMNLDVHGCYNDKRFCGTYKHQNGAEIQVWTPDAAAVQQWKTEMVRDGLYRIINKHSGKVIDLNPKDPTQLVQWQWNNSESQLWKIILVNNQEH